MSLMLQFEVVIEVLGLWVVHGSEGYLQNRLAFQCSSHYVIKEE
jgi:hypothetical protein